MYAIYCLTFTDGSNENQNKLIRRWIPKGTPIENYSDEHLRHIEDWMKRTAAEIFAEHMEILENSAA